MLKNVRAWYASPETNFGWFLLGNESAVGKQANLDQAKGLTSLT